MATPREPSRPGGHDPYAALRFGDFRSYLLGWFIALVGTRMQSVAIGWEMYQRTGDALSLGLVGLAQAWDFLYLVVFFAICMWIAMRQMERKLIK